MVKLTAADVARFESRVDRSTGHAMWTGHLDPDGYGILWVQGSPRRAHRIAWAIANNGGMLPPSEVVIRHSCDTPGCVDECHLATGSHADNVADRVAAGHNRRSSGRCSKGHPFDGQTKRGPYCKRCARERRLRNYYASKEESVV